MAPPPPATLPLVERLKQLAQTLQFFWFVRHLTLLLAVARYGLSYLTFNYYSHFAKISYRIGFIAAALTYGIVVYKQYIARGKLNGPIPNVVFQLLSDENVQYLGMALVWLYSRQIPLALLPFSVYSVFHVATYTRQYLLPTLQPARADASGPSSPRQPATSSPLADTIGKFVKRYYDTSMALVASLELALVLRLILTALTFSKGSWVLLLIYLAFFRARYSQSTFVQGVVAHATARLDTYVSHQNTPPAVRQGWDTFKGSVKQAYDITDIKRYIGGPGGVPAGKKPQ